MENDGGGASGGDTQRAGGVWANGAGREGGRLGGVTQGGGGGQNDV